MVTEGFSHPVVLLLLQVRGLLPVFHQQLLVHLEERLQLRFRYQWIYMCLVFFYLVCLFLLHM